MTLDEIQELFLRLVPTDYSTAVLGGDARSLFRGFWRGFGALSDVRRRRTQGSYLLPQGTQTDIPATFGRRAAFDVTIERTGSMELGLYTAPGKMILEGPVGRLYVNVDPIAFKFRDQVKTRTIRFECVVPGEVGNLDFLINNDLVSPTNSIDPEHLVPFDQSRGRSNRDATILQYAGSSSAKDTGIPSTFEASDDGLYVEVLFSSVASNIGRMLRVRQYIWPGIEEPPGSNTRPSYAVLDDAGIRGNMVGAKLDDGGVFTDNTDAANAGTPPFPLLPAAPAVADAFYFGAVAPISSLTLTIDTAGAGDFTITWEYWDGASWVAAAAVIDDTDGFTKDGERVVTFSDYALSVATTVDGVAAFWVRARVSAFVSLTTQPVASYIFPTVYQPLTSDAGDLEWAVRDWKDLGYTVTAIVQAELGREDDLFFLGDQRGQYRTLAESEEAFRDRIRRPPDVVSPNALTRTVNKILAPLFLKGVVMDPGDIFEGFFLDHDFFDYYNPGDLFPTSPWHLLSSLNETYGFFWVRVPWIAAGDFGIFYDAGPTLYLADLGLYLGPAYDSGFYDGFSMTGQTIYRAIYEEVRRRKAGGVDFAIIPDASLNVPP